MYRKAAEFWAELRLELLSACELSAEEKSNSSQIWRLYWASHQVLLPCIYKISFSDFLSPLNIFCSSMSVVDIYSTPTCLGIKGLVVVVVP
jgi:hypothetical protein